MDAMQCLNDQRKKLDILKLYMSLHPNANAYVRSPIFFEIVFFELEPSDTLMNPCSNAPKMQKLSVSMLAL